MSTSSTLFVKRLFIFNLIMICIVCFMPSNSKISPLFSFDKVIHFSIHLALSLNLMVLLIDNSKIKFGVLALIGFGIFIEIVQHYIPSRGFEYADIIANSSGTIAGAIIYIFNKTKIHALIESIFNKIFS